MSIIHSVITGLAAAPPTAPPTATTPAGSKGAPQTVVTGANITQFLENNILPIIILIIGLAVLGHGRKGDASKAMLTVGLTGVGLAVIAIGLDAGTGVSVGKWLLSLANIHTA